MKLKNKYTQSVITTLCLQSVFLISSQECEPLAIIKEYLPNNPIIVEAGAYNGEDTVRLANMVPTCCVHTFEPVPNLFNKVVHATQNLPNVKPYCIALSDRNGAAQFFVSNGFEDGAVDASSSLLLPEKHLIYFPHIIFNKTITVETITLDTWAELNNITHIDFMWLDLQGFELMVLKASEKILKTTTAIYTEVFIEELYKDAPLYPDLRAWLEQRGFVVKKEWLGDIFGEVLFVRI